MESKKHFKMYKNGKLWCTVAISAIALGIGLTNANNVQPVHAATEQVSSALATSASSSSVSSSSASDQTTTDTTKTADTATTGSTAIQATSTASQASDVANDTSAANSATINSHSISNVSAETATATTNRTKVNQSTSTAVTPTGEVGASSNATPLVKEQTPENGYATGNDENSLFYKDGKLANGYLNDGANWYFFKNGAKQSDVQKWDGTYYYFDHTTYQRVDNSYVKSNWGDYYLFGKDGKILTDVQQWAGSYYYFDHHTYLRVDNNYVKSNWGDYYLFGANGRILTDVQQWAGSYYYFNHNTYLRVDNQYLKSNWGDWYLFGKNGRIASGFANWDNRTYYFNPSTYLKETNAYVKSGNNTYWLDGTGVMRTKSWQIEQAIAIGMSLIGKSPYNWGGGRTLASIAAKSFDCSSFIHYIFSRVGINLGNYSGATTYTEIKLGTAVSWANMRRGDIFFMDNVGHVGMYLGNGLFLHDSPRSSTGGVGINNLSDVNPSPVLHGKTWAQISDGIVRRIVS